MTKLHKDLKSHKIPASEEEPHEDKKSHTLYIDTGTSILLQTAPADAYKPNEPETTVGVRVILGSGSQRSYITTELKDILNLPMLKSEPLMIKTFNSETRKFSS